VATIAIDWWPIETCTEDKDVEVLLKGLSGSEKPHSTFVCLGFRNRGNHWRMPGGQRLSNLGWKPTHWAIWPKL
jgi:hypothetical protein